jgi:hypothetical protein
MMIDDSKTTIPALHEAHLNVKAFRARLGLFAFISGVVWIVSLAIAHPLWIAGYMALLFVGVMLFHTFMTTLKDHEMVTQSLISLQANSANQQAIGKFISDLQEQNGSLSVETISTGQKGKLN